jgi:hypothetical protein
MSPFSGVTTVGAAPADGFQDGMVTALLRTVIVTGGAFVVVCPSALVPTAVNTC